MDGDDLAEQESGGWIGAIEFLDDSPKFTASARAKSSAKVLTWDVAELRALCTRNPSIAIPLQSALSEEVKASLIEHERFSRLASYRAVLSGVLADDTVTDDEHAFILRYRHQHSVTEEEHRASLESLGYSATDYATAMQRQNSNHYRSTMAGVLADGTIDGTERLFLGRFVP